MHDETLPHDEPPPHGGMLTGAALRAVDACLNSLQGLHDRLEPPVEEADTRGGRSRRTAAVEEPAAATVPQAKSLARRALTVVLCLALGAGAGTLVAYRGLAQMLASREAVIEYQQEEIDLAKKEEALNLNARAKAQSEIAKAQAEMADYRKRLRETQQEIEDRNSRIDELDKQLVAIKQRTERPKPQVALANAAKGRPTPQKTGNCVTGGANTTGQLLDCLDKFNRP